MTDRYAVIGHPVAHSKSPRIHAAFAAQTGQDLVYDRVEGRVADFEAQVRELVAQGLRGLNVTLPFKERALALAGAQTRSPAAVVAGAANTLWFEGEVVHADNTDGCGLMADLQGRLGWPLAGARILVLGAGGAVRGILGPLAAAHPACLQICNRTLDRAQQMVLAMGPLLPSSGGGLSVLEPHQLQHQPPFDLVVNGTSASLSGETLTLPPNLFHRHAQAYDLAYRAEGPTVFMEQARAAGVRHVEDGLGMLVEQAADAFQRWRGVRPRTAPVLAALRA